MRLASKLNYTIPIRAGGRSWPVWSLRDEAILVDLELFTEIHLDEGTGIVRVSPSVSGLHLHQYLASKDRVFSVGHCPDVGVGGALLCGGMGWNCNVSLLRNAGLLRR